MSEWIKCSEKMPYEGVDVLLWSDWAITGFYEDGGFFTEDGSNPIHNVTHWMPLPEPPEESNG